MNRRVVAGWTTSESIQQDMVLKTLLVYGNLDSTMKLNGGTNMYSQNADLKGFDTGFESLNKWTGGWRKGDLIILASRPAVGKTTCALNLAQKVCARDGVVDFFTLETIKLSLAKRMISSMARINGVKWKNPTWPYNEEDRIKAIQALDIYKKWRFDIHDDQTLTISDIRAQVQETQIKYPNENYLVFIDYLQLITIIGQYDSHALAIFHFTKELKEIAEQYQVPIILVSHLSSDVEVIFNKRPLLCDPL